MWHLKWIIHVDVGWWRALLALAFMLTDVLFIFASFPLFTDKRCTCLKDSWMAEMRDKGFSWCNSIGKVVHALTYQRLFKGSVYLGSSLKLFRKMSSRIMGWLASSIPKSEDAAIPITVLHLPLPFKIHNISAKIIHNALDKTKQ